MDTKKVLAAEVREELYQMTDEMYRKFHASLVPGKENILGVRMPQMRKLAKKLAGQDWEEWFCQAKDSCYEETMLRGLTMAYAKLTCEERLNYIQRFVPCIDNWAVCDCVCNTIKDAEKYPQEYWDFLAPYFTSEQEYEARFGAVMLLSHFVKREYLEESVARLEQIHQEGYYAKMAVAWALSVYFAAFPREMLLYLQNDHNLDAFTYKKTLQKIIESYRVDQDTKKIIQEMRRRG